MPAGRVGLPQGCLGEPGSTRVATNRALYQDDNDEDLWASDSDFHDIEHKRPPLLPRRVNAAVTPAAATSKEADLIVAFLDAVRQACASPRMDGRVEDPLPPMPPRTAPGQSPADADATVAALQAHLGGLNYNALGAPHLDERDAIGRLTCQLVVLGFPVNEHSPMLDPKGSGLAKSMQPLLITYDQLGGDSSNIVVVDIHPRAADWTACRKGLLDKQLMKKTAQLLLAIQWRGEIHAFGKHAIEALRDEMGAHSQLLGDQYGLSAPRYAFTNGSAVVVGFVHPQNLLASWSGGRTAAAYAGIVDTYARRHRAREGWAPPTTSVEVWVATHVAQMSPGQRDFERLGQMRSDEKYAVRNGGAITPFGAVPVYVQLALAAYGKGATFWMRPQTEWLGYPSPLFALLSINGKLGGKASMVLRHALATSHGLDPSHQAVAFGKLAAVLTALLAAWAKANGAEPPPTLEQAARMGPADPLTQRPRSLFACPGRGCLGACPCEGAELHNQAVAKLDEQSKNNTNAWRQSRRKGKNICTGCGGTGGSWSTCSRNPANADRSAAAKRAKPTHEDGPGVPGKRNDRKPSYVRPYYADRLPLAPTPPPQGGVPQPPPQLLPPPPSLPMAKRPRHTLSSTMASTTVDAATFSAAAASTASVRARAAPPHRVTGGGRAPLLANDDDFANYPIMGE